MVLKGTLVISLRLSQAKQIGNYLAGLSRQIAFPNFISTLDLEHLRRSSKMTAEYNFQRILLN